MNKVINLNDYKDKKNNKSDNKYIRAWNELSSAEKQMLTAMLELDHVDDEAIQELCEAFEYSKQLTKKEIMDAKKALLYDDDKLNSTLLNKGDD